LKNHLTGPAGSVAWFPFTIRTGRFVAFPLDGTTAEPVSVSMMRGEGPDIDAVRTFRTVGPPPKEGDGPTAGVGVP